MNFYVIYSSPVPQPNLYKTVSTSGTTATPSMGNQSPSIQPLNLYNPVSSASQPTMFNPASITSQPQPNMYNPVTTYQTPSQNMYNQANTNPAPQQNMYNTPTGTLSFSFLFFFWWWVIFFIYLLFTMPFDFPTFYILRFMVIHVKLKTLSYQFTRGPSERIVQYISDESEIVYSLIENIIY